jgi:hypothetical protein
MNLPTAKFARAWYYHAESDSLFYDEIVAVECAMEKDLDAALCVEIGPCETGMLHEGILLLQSFVERTTK